MNKIKMNTLLNSQSLSREHRLMSEYDIRPIPLEKLFPSPMNFYDVSNLDYLVESMAMSGLRNPIIVKPTNNEGMHEIISGNRRFESAKILASQGDERFLLVLCIVKESENDHIAELELINDNATIRVLTPQEQVKQAERIRELCSILRKEGKVQGHTRNFIAHALGVSRSQAGVLEKIGTKLEPEVRELFDKGEIGITQADAIASLPIAEQSQMAARAKVEGKESLNEYIGAKRRHKAQSTDDTVKREDQALAAELTSIAKALADGQEVGKERICKACLAAADAFGRDGE